ncbi:hypothetical protein B0T20DRAFT_348372 [Sordaria brevicollis]|uniref:Uncharacterized protein n=1 Tax=Sordaria brevicollis TaxID=83679 RepID=A0AAE0UEF2_SORBR|nr:hypothetical protein B0T20DRAFT_348372 [Sordaria brevicollis]
MVPIRSLTEPIHRATTPTDPKKLISTWTELDRLGMYHTSRSQFELGLRAFTRALHLCSLYPTVLGPRRPLVLISLGWTNRMFGRYDQAVAYLQQAMDELEQDDYIDNWGTNVGGPGRWIYTWSELAITWQLMGRLRDAAKAWRDMYEMARTSGLEWPWEGAYGRLECMCRAAGNEGVVSYLMAAEAIEGAAPGKTENCEGETNEFAREEAKRLLRVAVESLKERIQLATQVRQGFGDMDDERVVEDGADIETVRKKYQARAWQIIGGYLQELVDLDVDLNLLDEHGYSAMDYVVFVGDAEAESILVAGLKKQFGDDGQKVALLQEGARLRKAYRELFQEQLRPVLLEGGEDCLHKLRRVYAEALNTDAEKRRMFDHLKHLSYAEFVKFGRLPRSSDGLHKPFRPGTDDGSYIIFFSYRWINKDPALRSPDDADNTQYKRMIDAVDLFLQEHPEVDQEKLCIWMDFACVDQDNPSAGVAALPMILSQCDAVISLVDDEYYDRAWCSVEVLLIQTLQRAYGVHKWYEHVLIPGSSGSEEGEYTEGKLVDAGRPVKRWNLLCPILQKDINMAEKKLSLESDRPRVMFLERQSRLLG